VTRGGLLLVLFDISCCCSG